jgi:uncharacterized protein YbjT (DUF2867 family)
MSHKILIIGATGFIGANLLKRFELEQKLVRVLARTPSKVMVSSDLTQVVQGDLDDPSSLVQALDGIDVVYYLAHAMGESGDFLEREKVQAQNLGKLLNPQQRVIYLGGILPEEKLSTHLESRRQVGDILRTSAAKTIEFRASIIIGRGSASFELIRALVQRLPVIILANWANAHCQPIALDDVLDYLTAAADCEMSENHKVFNIAGPDVLPYGDLLKRYASFKGLKRSEIYIASFPKELVTKLLPIVAPEYAEVGIKLLDSIELPTTLNDNDAQDFFKMDCMSLEESFDHVDDRKFEQISMSELSEHFKGSEIPSYVLGEGIQLFIPLAYSLPLPERERDLNLKFIGELKVFYKPQLSGVQVFIRPSFFFQSIGWIAFKHVLNFIQGMQDGKFSILFKK